MRIEQGFGKFNINEEVEVELLQIKYTKQNHRPYAVVDAGEGRFNVNIKDSDTTLKPGRYKIICTGVNPQGFCYINLEKLQHFSWDKHDEAIKEVEVGNTTVQEYQNQQEDNPLAYNIRITDQYIENLKLEELSFQQQEKICDCVNEILGILYKGYGLSMYRQLEAEEDELS